MVSPFTFRGYLGKKYLILQRKEYSPVLSISTTHIKAIARFFNSSLVFALGYMPSINTTANFNGKISEFCYFYSIKCSHSPHQLFCKFHLSSLLHLAFSRMSLKKRAYKFFQKNKEKKKPKRIISSIVRHNVQTGQMLYWALPVE